MIRPWKGQETNRGLAAPLDFPGCFRKFGVPWGIRPHIRSTYLNEYLSARNCYRDDVALLNKRASAQVQIGTSRDTQRQWKVQGKVILPLCNRERFDTQSDQPSLALITTLSHSHVTKKHHLDHAGGRMARINIEDSLFKDRRYQAFMLKVGDPTLALGAFVEACIVAQEFYLNEDTGGRVPLFDWESRGIRKEIIESGLAELVDGFVKLRGSDEQFAWLTRAKKAGEASANSRQRKSTQVNASEPLTLTPTPTLPLTLSPNSSSDSFSFSSTDVGSAQSANADSRGALPGLDMDDVCISRLTDVSEKLQAAWLQAYPSPEWICAEIRRANVWLIANPKKNPKKFGLFMSNWLSRAFEEYRKGIPSNRQTTSQRNADALTDMHSRVTKGEL